MDTSRQTQAEGLVTLVWLEALQQAQMQPIPVALRVALDITNPLDDRIIATAHVAQARSQQEAPLHVHLAPLATNKTLVD